MILICLFNFLTLILAQEQHNIPNQLLLEEILDLSKKPTAAVPKHFSKDSWIVETPTWFESVPYVGYTQKKNLTIRSVLRHRDQIIWNKTYHTDFDGNRARPLANRDLAEKESIFLMGCSYIFGLGLNDDETITHQLALLLRGFNVRNISIIGSGPHMTLAQLQNENKYFSPTPKRDIYIYNYSEIEHLARSNGLMKELSWVATTPYYEVAGHGDEEHLVTKGDFLTARPIMTKALNFLRDYIFTASDYQLPIPSDSHRKKMCLIFKEMKNVILKGNPQAHFYVSYFAMTKSKAQYYDDCFKKYQINTLSPSHLERQENENAYPHDSHPNAKGTRLMATGLYEALKKAEAVH